MISLIVDSSQIQGSMTGQEVRDMLFARLFGLTAVIRSGLVVRTTPLPTLASFETLASSLAGYQETISQLIALGEKKSWLREGAWWTVALAIDSLHASDVPWKSHAIETTLEALFVENKDWSPEKIALTVKLQGLYPTRDWKRYLSPSFKNADILSNANLVALARILKVRCLSFFNNSGT
jgi:DNA polymerase phi